MRTVNIADLKAHLSAHIQRVRDGEEVLVCDRNRPVARIVPCPLEELLRAGEAAYCPRGSGASEEKDGGRADPGRNRLGTSRMSVVDRGMEGRTRRSIEATCCILGFKCRWFHSVFDETKYSPSHLPSRDRYDIVVWWATPVEITSGLARLVRMNQISSADWTEARIRPCRFSKTCG